MSGFVMPDRDEGIWKRYKIQTKNRFGDWVDFGPFYFNTQESMMKYFDEYESTLGKARIVEVTETVLRYTD
jgi:hypothetical protein